MHNTPEQNEAFRKAFDETNARWRAAVAHDKLQKEINKEKTDLNLPQRKQNNG